MIVYYVMTGTVKLYSNPQELSEVIGIILFHFTDKETESQRLSIQY